MVKVKESSYSYYDVNYKDINKNKYKEIIASPKCKNINDLFSVLHEIGHCRGFRDLSQKRKILRWIYSSILSEQEGIHNCSHLNSEIYAWLYVFDCVKTYYYKDLINICIPSFISYLENSTRKRKKYWIKKLKRKIVNKILANSRKQSKNIIEKTLKEFNL
jgi:hypothetical protein